MDSTRRSNPRNPSLSSSSGSTRYVPRKFPSNHPTNSAVPSPNPNPNHGTGISGRTTSNQLKSTNRQEEDKNNPVSLAGTCPFMCPAGERVQRERLRDLAIFERLNGNPGKTSPELAVKKFCRTISSKDTHASDLRPLLVLDNTLKYLLNMIDSTERPFEEVHDFIFDRTRSIRQDLSIQNIVNDQAIQMYEEMVKFHIISHHKLRSCNSSPNISSMHYLNMEQLTKSLTSLYNLYEANRRSNSIHENEAEYHSFYVLLHLNSISEQSVHLCSHCSSSSFSFLRTIMNYLLDPKLDISISDPQGESLSLWFRNVSSNINKSQEMCFARRVLRFLRMGNYKQFLSIVVTEASYLQYCIIEPYMNEVRALALSYINHGCYKLHPYPLADLATVLMMKDSDVESLCNSCGLEVYTDEVGNKFLPTKQTSFCYPKEGFQKYCCLGLERYERKNTARGM